MHFTVCGFVIEAYIGRNGGEGLISFVLDRDARRNPDLLAALIAMSKTAGGTMENRESLASIEKLLLDSDGSESSFRVPAAVAVEVREKLLGKHVSLTVTVTEAGYDGD